MIKFILLELDGLFLLLKLNYRTLVFRLHIIELDMGFSFFPHSLQIRLVQFHELMVILSGEVIL